MVNLLIINYPDSNY